MAETAPPASAAPPPADSYLGADGRPVDWTKVYLGFSGLAIGQFMALLDIQIVAAALAEIQASIGATADEIGWIQSIYLLAEVVAIPLSAYMTKMWGTRPFYIAATLAFVITSVAVGLANSIETMIFFRALQGLAAGAMIPATFAMAMTVFPLEKRLHANVIVSVIVTLGPTFGPTLGGHLTDLLSWRWLFFVNIAPGLLVLFLVGRYADFDRPDRSLAKGIDWTGLVLMAVFLLSMQYLLEEGAEEGWFDDDLILWLTVITVISGVAFIWRELTYRQPIVSLKPFVDRNFTLGCAINFVAGSVLFGGTFILPLYLAHVRGFSAAEVGMVMLISGLVMLLSSPVLGRIVRALDFRISLVVGLLLTAWGMAQGGYLTKEWGFWEFAVLQSARGLGAMLSMIAASQMSVATMPLHMMKDASGLLNLIRNVGGAVGMAVLSTIMTTQTAEHYNALTARMSTASPSGQDFLAFMTNRMIERGVADPDGAARKAIGFMINREASVLAYGEAFMALAVGCLVAALLAFFASPPASAKAFGPAARGAV